MMALFVFVLVLCMAPLPAMAAERTFLSPRDMGPYETPSRHSSGTITYNLGPTGARGWARAYNGGERFWGENGKELIVTWVDPGSPADGKLAPHDVIFGAAGNAFDRDARVCLGEAIAAAQKSDGRLALLCWRDGNEDEVPILLPRLPTPATSRKWTLDFLVDRMHPAGFKMHASYRCPNVLYLLANGDPRHLDHVRRNVRLIIDSMPGEDSVYGPWHWVNGCDTMVLAEYFLATGDRTVLPAMERYCAWMRASQSYAGGFSHGGPYGGYGHVALPGLFNSIGMVLARECGVTGYDDMIAAAARFYSRAAGMGMMSYGGDTAIKDNLKTLYGDNGKCGAAAVFYDVLGDRATSRTYARTACALAPYSESGHSGHFWSVSWGALGANRADDAYREYYNRELEWYYAMARTWRGGLTAQPWCGSMGSYSKNGGEANTGGLALWSCVPLKSLRVLGGGSSVFGQELDGPLAEARRHIYDRDYHGCLAMLDGLELATAVEKAQADQLRRKAHLVLESIALTTASIRRNIDTGDLFTAERQLNALKPVLKNTSDMAELDRALTGPEAGAVIASGKTYYELMRWVGSADLSRFHRAPSIALDAAKRNKMAALAESPADGAYAAMARLALAQWPAEPPKPRPVTLVAQDVAIRHANTLYLSKEDDADAGVRYRYYEFDAAPETTAAVRDMQPVAGGSGAGFDISPRKRNRNFAFIFNTFVSVDVAGQYTFTLTSDDGGLLCVNGNLLIDHGGRHGMTPKSASIRLQPGRHELECIMFQGAGGYGLKVEMASPAGRDAAPERSATFTVDDPGAYDELALRVKARGAVTVCLNDEVICRLPRKRRKRAYDNAWSEWERVGLRSVAGKLLRKGSNSLTVRTAPTILGGKGAIIGVQLQAYPTPHGNRTQPVRSAPPARSPGGE